MKWPFARHAHSPEPASGGAGPVTIVEPTRPAVATPARRDWATLPPLKVAGGRPISLTAATRAFTQSLASQQVLVHSPRLEMVRQIDAPSGSFRGVLAPAISDSGAGPELQEASPLPAIEHRHVAAVAGDHHEHHGGQQLSAIDQLLAIDAPGGRIAAPGAVHPVRARQETYDDPGDDVSLSGGEPGGQPGAKPGDGRAGLADSRRRGLGPAYHGPLPEAMRAERERHDGPDTEVVPADVRATMRDVLGVDVGDRLVHRGPAVSAEADAMGAQAFTRDGQIYLHDDVGPLDQPRGRATLAHELTHAAQQIVHNALHDEATAAGQALEAHAQRVEQYVRGDAGAIKPTPDLLHARPATTAGTADQGDSDVVSSAQKMMRDMIDSGLARSDGTGGIVFTMPPSSMTASAGTQRLAGDAPTAHATSQTQWDPMGSLGNTLGQGLANDVLGMAGSMFGFSDEFMGEQRQDLASQDRQFRREQTTQAYSELRLEHLRRVELTNLNDSQRLHDLEQSTELDTRTLEAIDARVNEEITERLTLLDTQTAAALERLNQQRATRREAELLDVPDEGFNAALVALFDNAENPVLPSEDALLATLATPTTPGRGSTTRPGGGTAPRSAGGPPGGGAPTARSTGAPTSSPASPTTATPPTGGATATPTGTGTGTGTGAADTEQHWRTDATVGGRFEALGEALAGDIAHAELGFFGSVLGFDDEFEQGMHDEITPRAGAAGTGATATTAATAGAPPDAAHAGTAHPDAQPAGAAHPGAAGATVDNIVGDPYALDELATRLYPTIRSRLRQELLIDRERAGLLADFR